MSCADAELLRKAVVSLEKKLQDKVHKLSEVQQERDGLQQDKELWYREQRELQQATADVAQLRQDVECKDSELRRLHSQADSLQASCSTLQAQVAELQACNSRLSAQLEQWKADREAAEVGCIRAQSQQQFQQAMVQQLETANEALRLDVREHATKLQQAYEREAQLLSEVGTLKEAQRRKSANPPPDSPVASAPQPPPCTHTQRLDGLHRDLFLAAAQHMLKEFLAKVVQAEDRAAAVGKQLQHAEAKFIQLASHSRTVEAQLQEQSEQCRREEQAVQALLASNMRLHENMLQLMDHAAAAGAAAATAVQSKAAAPRGRQYQKATHASQARQQQQGRDNAGRVGAALVVADPASQAECACCEHSASLAATPRQAARRQLYTAATAPGATIKAVRSLASSRQSMVLEGAADPGLGSISRSGSSVAHLDAARTAAVETALAISTEYKELHDYYKAVVAEVLRVGSCLAVACGQDNVQQLKQQHGQLQKELWDVAEQLELKVSELTALKQAGLLRPRA